jgi:valyl-tRNA synthetase
VIKPLPKTYDFSAIEPKWQKKWEEEDIYRFDWNDKTKPTYSIDTPPPYPSGEFHMGNALNWCYFDFVARYKRMRGYNVYFPQGWDCHGLPTEVRAEKVFNIKKGDLPPEKFIELCVKLTTEYIEKMKTTMKKVGYSIDWHLEYRTMNPEYYRKTQLSFILLYKKGFLYRTEHPVNWCPRCETAIAEAEVEYVEKTGEMVYLKFATEVGNLLIATTRPELIPACVGIAVHPDDQRYVKYVGKMAEIPLFGRKVPVLADEKVDPKFGTGAVMICTFGDKTDVYWQKRYNLPVIKAIAENGAMTSAAGKYKGLTVEESKKAIIADLEKAGLIEKREPLSQRVGTCWRCHTPVEIISKLQWFMNTRALADEVVAWTEKISWIPEFAKYRMLDWTRSLDWDWVISRQRIFATPIPAWYCKQCGNIVVAEETWLPVDPRTTNPSGLKCQKCGSNDFIGESDVMDTWMDSSITCAVHAGWPDNLETFNRLFPADLQPNGTDIIRTWDYYLMVRHLALFGQAPYKIVLINGMVRGTDGRMMHKSYGNYVEAQEVIAKYGADALRQWAAGGGATGSDIPFRWEDVEYGWKFIVKLWNAARFASLQLKDYNPKVGKVELTLLDKWLISKLEETTKNVTEAFENFQFNLAIEAIRTFTWHILCDQYIETVKHRLYRPEQHGEKSRLAVQYTLYNAIYRVLQLLAPICPHITEELYQLIYAEEKGYTSIHLSPWPTVNEALIDKTVEEQGNLTITVIEEIRRAKAKNKLPLNAPIKRLVIFAEEDKAAETLRITANDIAGTCKVEELNISAGKEETGFPVEGYPNIRFLIEH